jgi:CRP/FNR family transcriptional regulator
MKILGRCGFFSGLDKTQLAVLEPIARICRFPAGQTVVRVGEACPGIYVVGEGSARIYRIAPNGKEHVLHFAHPGMTFLEVAVIGEFNCPAYVQTLEPMVSVLLPGQDFRRILKTNHDFCLQLMSGMAKWVRHLLGILEDIVLRDASGRVARYLLQQMPEGVGGTKTPGGDALGAAPFALPTRKKDLASFLNLTSETLSRTLRRLAECGLIEMPDAQQIRILNEAALRDVADGVPPAEFARE